MSQELPPNRWNIGGSMAKLRDDVNILAWLWAEEKWKSAQPRQVTVVTTNTYTRDIDWSCIHDYVSFDEADTEQQHAAKGALDGSPGR